MLSDEVINRIAAGEVIERPASVLKELLENALDAGARHIEAEVTAGGKKVIRVSDDGQGMSPEDARQCIQRHATSKLSTDRDLERIQTLGFRGEALAAVAGVSRFQLVTRPADRPEATELVVHGGRVESCGPAGAPPGTSVTVRNLFYNVPARRKFLRQEATELGHLRRMFLVHAVAHPDVAFQLTIDEREAYRFPAGDSLDERIAALYRRDTLARLKAVAYEDGGICVRGRISDPHLHRPDRADQFIFINGRPAAAPMIAFAVREAYRDVLPSKRHPVLFLFIDVPPDTLDVNVHPTKREVRFRRSGTVRDALIAAMREALTGRRPEPMASGSLRVHPGKPPAPTSGQEPAPVFIPPPRTARQEEWGLEPLPTTEPDGDRLPENGPWRRQKIVSILEGPVLVIDTDAGVVFLDVRSAYQRVVYERWSQAREKDHTRSQGLLSPESLDLQPPQAALLRKHLDALKALGFGVAEFGGDSFLVDAVPAELGEVHAEALLRAVLSDLAESGSARSADVKHIALMQAVCRQAGRLRARWNERELQALAGQLLRTEMPYTAPDGKPTLFLMSHAEIRGKLGRKNA